MSRALRKVESNDGLIRRLIAKPDHIVLVIIAISMTGPTILKALALGGWYLLGIPLLICYLIVALKVLTRREESNTQLQRVKESDSIFTALKKLWVAQPKFFIASLILAPWFIKSSIGYLMAGGWHLFLIPLSLLGTSVLIKAYIRNGSSETRARRLPPSR